MVAVTLAEVAPAAAGPASLFAQFGQADQIGTEIAPELTAEHGALRE